jgi:DNA gyrase subunit B
MAEYDASDIKVLTGLEAVRRRPGMYVGDPEDGSGMHQLVWNLVDRAFAAHLDGTVTTIRVQVEGGTVVVEDDGAGIPVHPMPGDDGRPVLEAVFTQLCGGAHLESRWHDWCGFALPVVNALSTWLEVMVWHGGRTYRQRHERGQACGPISDLGSTTRSGTRITFTPDFTILSRRAWDVAAIASRLHQLAALGRSLTTICQHEVFRSPAGLADHARYLAGDATPLHAEPIHLRGVLPDLEVEVALLWTDASGPRTAGFVNGRPVGEGAHIRGLVGGLRRVFAQITPSRLVGVHRPALDEAVARGRVALVHVVTPYPGLAGYRGDELDSPDVRDAVRSLVSLGLGREVARSAQLRKTLLARLPG